MNRLRDSSSPYLLQHADNPVDWFPWGPEALRKARQEDKPIFLSIGYAACHWCHVMAHESFEDSETAKLMNERFVNIKVDREERPDVDALYMDAVVAMTGQGGWPMSVFLTPQGQPFFGGTYFPPERRHGMPGFKELLIGIAQAWQEDRDRLLDTGQKLADHLRTGPRIPVSERPLSADILERATARLHEQYDWTYGGWGRAPKFPQASAIEFLFRRHQRAGDKHARDMAIDALRAMASGGIYDQLGGGFHRYSVDREWLVPHFEKMLYDNALLLATYLRGWQVTREPQFLTVAEETFAFLEREMRGPAGGYASSLDADTDGEEGKYYLWTLAEVEEAIGDARTVEIVQRALGVTPSGNFEGANVLYRAQEPAPLADTFQLPADDLATRLAAAQSELLARRERRPRPGLDDKVLAAWNGLLLRALAIGAQVTRGSSWLKAARSLADFLVEKMIVDGRLRRSWRQGQARFNAYLEDYGALGVGLLELYAVDGTHRWFRVARSLADGILERFRDPEGGFFDTADDHEELIARPKSLQDSPIPSGSTLATALLQRMWALTGEDRYRQPAEAAIEAMVEPMAQHPTAFAGWLAELDFALGPQLQLALVGDPASDEFQSLAATAHAHYLPNLVIAGGPADPEDGPELLEGRSLLEGRPAAYLCQGFTCRRPTAEPSELAQQLEAAA